MKFLFSFILFILSNFVLSGTEETKTLLLNKDEYKYLESKNLLVSEAIKNAFGTPNKQNNYSIDINQVDAWNSKVTEFRYYPGINGDNKKSLLNSSVNNTKENIIIKLRVSVNTKNSNLNSIILPYLDEKNSFILNVVVIGDNRIFVSESKNKIDFFDIIDNQSFADNAFKSFFGENPKKMNYNIAFNKTKACLVKNILSGVCNEDFELNKTTSNYLKFSEKITSPEYSAMYILFDLPIIRGSSNLNDKIEESLIKETDGTEHLKFYFCIPKDNLKARKKKALEIEGKILSSTKTAVKNLVVYLRDGFNTVVNSQTTNQEGYFKFDKLQEGASYSLYIDNSSKEESLFLATKKDKIIGEFKKSDIGFEYRLLDVEITQMSTVEDIDPSEEFKSTIKGKMVSVTDKVNPIKEQTIELKNAYNKVLQTKKTDKEGYFEFNGINPKENYSIELPDYKETVKNEKVYLATTKNELVTQFTKNAAGKFSYKMLPVDISYLSNMQEEDVEMTFNIQKKLNENDIVIRDFIYFDLNSYNLSSQSIATLDKISKIISQNPLYKLEIISHTDCRGEATENLKLSQKRSESVMLYFLKKTIDPKRLKPIGMGESKPLNSCVDGKACLEDELKMNRRTEFKFYK
ncbi:MAG: OmpA family protein [Bacteroidota bacterium]|nr:OmpA family protein [Bacteroidota bacterium]